MFLVSSSSSSSRYLFIIVTCIYIKICYQSCLLICLSLSLITYKVMLGCAIIFHQKCVSGK